MITAAGSPLAEEYRIALKRYLAEGGDSALRSAGELGQKAAKEGLGSIALAQVHHRALATSMSDVPASNNSSKLLERGADFFAEILAPLESSKETSRADAGEDTSPDRRYQMLVESSRDIIFTMSIHGIITSINAAFESLVGWKREEWIGRHFVGLIHHADLSSAIDMFELALRGENPPLYELRIGSTMGTILVGEFTLIPQVQEGTTVGVFGFVRDITQRKKAEERIREQAALIEATHDAIIVCDLDENVKYWNPAAERLYGWTRREAQGRTLGEIMRHRDQAEFIQAHRTVFESGEWHGELCQNTRDFGEVIVESRWSLIRDSRGNSRAILIINTNITDRKNLEGRLLRFHRMETIGKLATGIAHDLNDVLSPILLGVQTLARALPADSHREIVASVESSIERGAGMIKQVLTFARGIGAERTTIQPGEILATVAEFARETFPKLIRIDAAPDDGVWSIRGNRDQLEQLLMNLCINARDGMPAGGTIKMGAENIVFDENYCLMNQDARPGPYVVLTVADTVTVIPKDKMEKVFDPLTRTIDHGAVAGLGLSTSFSIVRSHDGFIRASSEPEKGSEFKVYIPAMEATVIVRDNEQRKDLPTGNGETILVVDDEAAIREITKATLETFGYRVITASDGAEAVAVYADRPDSISLIFTDIMMTCMNGDSAIRSIRELNPGVKIVTTSGLTSVEQIRESVGTNDISFLPKPYTAEQLIKTVHSALSAG